MKHLILIGLITLLSRCAFADVGAGGSDAGNGGNTIVCSDAKGNITSVELLDFYEAQVKRGITPDLGGPDLTVDQKISMASNRLDAISAGEGDIIRDGYQLFKSNSVFLPGIHLTTINDSNQLFIPAGCQEEQTAIQKSPVFPGDKLFNIDQDLWNKMDADNQTGLILHEIFYHYALEYGKPADSTPVRVFTSSIASGPGISAQLFVDVLRQLDVGFVQIGDYDFTVTPLVPQFSNTGVLMGGPLQGSTPIQALGQKINVDELALYSNGAIYQFEPTDPLYVGTNHQSFWIAPNIPVNLNGDGSLESAQLLATNDFDFKKQGQYDLKIASPDSNPVRVVFNADGSIMECTECKGTATVNGKTIQVQAAPKRDWVTYSSNGDSLCVNTLKAETLEVGKYSIQVQGHLCVLDEGTDVGTVTDAHLNKEMIFNAGGKKVRFAPADNFSLDSQGQWVLGTLAEDADLKSMTSNTVVHFLKGMSIELKDDGSASIFSQNSL